MGTEGEEGKMKPEEKKGQKREVRKSMKSDRIFLSLIQQKLADLKYPSQIAKEISKELQDPTINKQKIDYWIKKMLDWGVIEELPESTNFMRLYKVIKYIAESELGNNERIYTFNPHNYRVKVRIISDCPNVHLPIVKHTGWHGKTVKEYYEVKRNAYRIKFERTSKSIIAALTPYRVEIMKQKEDFDRFHELLKKIVEQEIGLFIKKYGFELDSKDNWKEIQMDAKLKGGVISKLPPNLRFHDTVGKMVYPNTFEFKDIEGAKTFFANMTLKDHSPEIAKAIEETRAQLGGMMQQSVAVSNAILVQTKILKDLTNFITKRRKIRKVGIVRKMPASNYWRIIREAARRNRRSIRETRLAYKRMRNRGDV